MKAYIVKSTIKTGYRDIEPGAVLMQSPFGYKTGIIECATPTTVFLNIWSLNMAHLIHYTATGQLQEVEVRDLKWLQPHLLKQHKEELAKELLPS